MINTAGIKSILDVMATMSQDELAALYGVHLDAPHAEVIVRIWSPTRTWSRGAFRIPVRDVPTAERLARVVNNHSGAYCADYDYAMATHER